MKKLIVIGIVMVMVMGLAVAASAFTADSVIKMGLTFANGTLSQGQLTVGTLVGAVDGIDANDSLYPSPSGGAGEIDSTLNEARYQYDYHAPVITPSTCTAFNLKAYINGGAAGTCTLKAWMTSTGKIDSADYHVKLYAGTWTAQDCLSGAAGTALWQAPIGTSGTSSSPQFTQSGIAMDAQAVRFYTVTICTIPEPSSMVALFNGLVGLVGFGIRRRK